MAISLRRLKTVSVALVGFGGEAYSAESTSMPSQRNGSARQRGSDEILKWYFPMLHPSFCVTKHPLVVSDIYV